MNAIDITVGRTAVKALLVAVVVAAGVFGGVGTAAAEPMDGKGDDPFPPSLYASLDGKGNDVPTLPPSLYASLDGKGNDVYTPPGVYASLDGKGNDILTTAFPIDNVTVLSATYVGRGGGSGNLVSRSAGESLARCASSGAR
ncbi:hypothetical protein [Salinigranum halophilum]|uniref:hypothetical protein n=1 Tax=Salinigranum halophilum TaxID=2565931 RepID=UPI0010A83259|nr:hypothetical protein [Salinigranum halophilum]